MSQEERERAAEVLKALAHPVRLGVIEILAGGEQSCTELFERLGCSQSLMSQQLQILARQGLIAVRREGARKICTLRNRDFLKLFDCMHQHLRMFLHFKGESE
jgi:DNA-binding transcriptional ArsR family regulator